MGQMYRSGAQNARNTRSFGCATLGTDAGRRSSILGAGIAAGVRMIGGAIGAMAGMFLAIDQQNVNPDAYIPLLTFYAFTIVILGGPGTLFGPILGSMIFWFLFEFLDGVMTGLIVDMDLALLDALDATDVGPIRFALFGIGLMWLMISRPQGLFGQREEMLIDGRLFPFADSLGFPAYWSTGFKPNTSLGTRPFFIISRIFATTSPIFAQSRRFAIVHLRVVVEVWGGT